MYGRAVRLDLRDTLLSILAATGLVVWLPEHIALAVRVAVCLAAAGGVGRLLMSRVSDPAPRPEPDA